MRLSTAVLDRAAGALLATAAGDALGAGYEFGPPLPAGTVVRMAGGGNFGWAPGEWTDDTAMAIVIAQVAADGADLRTTAAQDRIASGWAEWAHTAKDVGIQTSAVLGAARASGRVDAASVQAASRMQHDLTGRSGGNGSLMRTAPVALAFLDDEDALIDAATAISVLTHHDPEAGEACVLWCLAIQHAVLTGKLDPRRGLSRLDPERATIWAARLDEAEAKPPSAFQNNGWVVHALQGAWSAISRVPVPEDNPAESSFRGQHLQLALEAAVRGGRDTDTVAAIAGGLLGAVYGASAVPAAWRRLLHGWPGLRSRDLVTVSTMIVTGTAPFDGDYSQYGDLTPLARHPYDENLWLGAIGAVRSLPAGVDAVVSLCRIRDADIPVGVEHVEVRLIDNENPDQNPQLGFVLHDTVVLVEQLRREGRTVLLHCVQAQSRTPTIAALYGARRRGVSIEQALAAVQRALPAAHPNRAFTDALASVYPTRQDNR